MLICISGSCDEYQIVPNLIIYLLVKIQPYPTSVAKDIDMIPPLCFLKNWNSREVETELFDHLNSWIRLRVEYQSCRMWNYLAADEISYRFDEPNLVTNFSVTADAAQTVYTACVEFYCVAYLFIASWKLYESYHWCLNFYLSDGGTYMSNPRWFSSKW